jgi:hypothetical protein
MDRDDATNGTANLEYIEGLPHDRLPGAMVPEFHEESDDAAIAGMIPQTRPDSPVAKHHRMPLVTMPSFAFVSTNGTALLAPIPFGRANTVRVDNLTSQWCRVGGFYINPFSTGWTIPLQTAVTTATLTWEAPATITQPAATTGANCYTVWYEERFPPTAGVDVAGAAASTLVTGAQTPGDAVANPTDAVDTRDFLQVWNPTDSVWDRMISAENDAMADTGLAAAGNMVWNGATWDRLLEFTSTDPTVYTGIPTAGIMLAAGGIQLRALRSASQLGDANAMNNAIASACYVYNGATYDRARGSNSGATGAVATTAAAPTAANMLDGFANVQATTTTTLVTVPTGRTWVGYVGTSCATSVAAGGAAATVSSAITTANGTGTTTPTAGTYARTDLTIAAVGAALSSVADTAQMCGQRLIVQAAGGTALIQHVGTIVNGTSPQASGWAIGELM